MRIICASETWSNGEWIIRAWRGSGINQAIYLLKRMLERQQEMFVEHGGVREQMSRARIAYRRGSAGAARSDKSDKV